MLIFSPLAFGTVEAWSYALMEFLIGLSALLLFLSPRNIPLYRPPGLIPLLLIAGYLLLQIIPLPPFLVRLLSPAAYHIYHQTAGSLNTGGWMSLSVHPRATFFELTRFLSYLVFYTTAVQLFTDKTLLKRTLSVVAVFAGVLSFLVIIQFITRQLNYAQVDDRIFWLRSSVHGKGSIGPYVNRNHYAGLMEMIFPLTVCLFLIYRPRSSAAAWKQRIRDFLVHPRINYHFLYGITALLIGTSVFISLSRGGIMSLTLAMAGLSIWLIHKTRNLKAGLITIVLFAGILILTGSNGWDRIFERFNDIRTESGEINTNRFHYWQDGGAIIADFPVTGSGVGTWQDIYPLYRTFPGISRLEHAHSDYIEFLATGGMILVGLLALALARIVYVSFLSYRRRRKQMAIYLFVGSLAAVLSILLHSFVDFNLQVGANGLYLFFVLAVMVSAAHTRFFKGSRPTYLPEAAVGLWSPRLTAAAFFAAMLIVHGGVLLANYHFYDYRHISNTGDYSDQDLRLVHQAAERSAFFDPLNAFYHQVAANTAVMLDDPETARRYYRQAARLYPLDVQMLQDAGRFYSRQKEMAIAGPLLRAGIDFSHNDIGAVLNYAAALFENDRAAEGRQVLTSAMSANPGKTDACLALMAWLGMPVQEMRQTLPERTQAFMAFGDFLASIGRYESAGAAYQEGLSYVGREKAIEKKTFLHVYRFFKNRRENDQALQVIRQALEYFPEDARLKRIVEK